MYTWNPICSINQVNFLHNIFQNSTNDATKKLCSMLAAKLWQIADPELEEGLQRMMILERLIDQLVATMKKMMK